MGRQYNVVKEVATLSLLVATCAVATAQPPPAPGRRPAGAHVRQPPVIKSTPVLKSTPPGFKGSPVLKSTPVLKSSPSGLKGTPILKNTPERFSALPPEDRQIFRRNAERWIKMGPEERKALREREKVYRERIKGEADAMLRETGLPLEGEKRELFEQRYTQERRRIERSLRQEAEAKRQQELPALKERLKKEFQESPAAGSAASPATSVAPQK